MTYIRPEYWFRPSQIGRRLAYSLGLTRDNSLATTPWGMPIEFDPTELHGRAMLTHGLADLRTNEMIARIMREGDAAVDIGANIGIMTSLMAACAGPSGSVYAFEPHPKTQKLLERNAQRWRSMSSLATAEVTVSAKAVSSGAGNAILHEPGGFFANSGIASLEAVRASKGDSGGNHSVETISFDEWLGNRRTIRLVKIDVEGHEDAVFLGMQSALGTKRIDYLIFEEMRSLPSRATELLESFGYSCFLLDRSFWGPVLVSTKDAPRQLEGEATNILAMRASSGIERFMTKGWRCLNRVKGSGAQESRLM